MPFSDSGLWIPREPPKKKSWRTNFTLPLVVTIISVVLSSVLAWFGLRASRINTKLAQRAYLGYKVELDPNQPFPGAASSQFQPQYRIMLTNLGNTSASNILVKPVDYEELFQPIGKVQNALPQKAPNAQTLYASPSLFDLGPKETEAVEAFGLDSLRTGHASGSIVYFDVFGDLHKQSYCAELRLNVLQKTQPGDRPPKFADDHYFVDCEGAREEVVEERSADVNKPWEDESARKEYFGAALSSDEASKKTTLRPRCGIEGLQDCSH